MDYLSSTMVNNPAFEIVMVHKCVPLPVTVPEPVRVAPLGILPDIVKLPSLIGL